MTAPPPVADAPWSRRRLLGTAAAGHAVLVLCAIRHTFFWGGDLAPVLHLLEAAGLCAFTLLAGLAFWRALRQAERLDTTFLIRTGTLLALIAALAPPFLSNDLYDYLARGRVEVLGHDPYVTTVASLADDPAMQAFAARARWPEWVMPYGPLAAALQWAAALPDSPWIGAYLWKVAAAAAHVATAVVAMQTLRLHADDNVARRGLVLWLWNPWLLLESCGSGHNDAFAALGLVLMCRAVAQLRFTGAALGYGLGMLVKHGSPPLAPLLLVAAARQRRLPAFLLGTAIIAAILLAAWWRYWRVDGGLDWILAQSTVARGSLTSLLAEHVFDAARTVVPVAGLAVLTACLAAGMARVADARTFARFGALSMVVFLFACVPNFAPWYHLWWLPLFTLAASPAIDRTLVVLAFTGPLSYVLFAATHGFGPWHEAIAFALCGLWPSVLVLRRWRDLVGRGRQ